MVHVVPFVSEDTFLGIGPHAYGEMSVAPVTLSRREVGEGLLRAAQQRVDCRVRGTS